MPTIPRYERQQTVSGQSPNALANPSSFAATGQAIAGAANELGDILIKRSAELKQQEDDNYLISEGTKLNDNYMKFRVEVEQDPQFQSGNYEGMSKSLADFSKKQLEGYSEAGKDRPDLFNKIQGHVSSLQNSLQGHFSTVASSRIKANGEVVRKNDLESSMQISRSGDYALGITNFQKTLEAQKANGLLSPAMYDMELKVGRSRIAEAHIEQLAQTDPVSAKAVFNAFAGEKVLLTDTAERLDRLLKPAVTRQTGTTVGRDIYQSDTSGNLETMINAVKDKKLTSEVEKHAIDEIKDSWQIKEAQEAETAESAKKKVNSILVPVALKRNGINQSRDLTPAQWAELERDNPEYAAQLQDKIRREQREIERERKTDIREARTEARFLRQEQRYAQGENENSIMLEPDFMTRDIDSDFALGKINREGRNRLLRLQQSADPMKHEAVKRAIKKIDSGTALQEALNLSDKNIIAAWKQKYGDVVKAYAYNNFDKPDFEKNLGEFLDKNVFSELVGSWMDSDNTKRQTRLKTAEESAGQLPERGKKRQTNRPAQNVPQSGAVVKGYRFKGGDPSNKANWEKAQ